MKNQACVVTSVLWITAVLALSACQAAVTVQPTSVPPTNTTYPTPVPTEKEQVIEPKKSSVLSAQWSFKTGGPIWGTPTVANGVVYVGSDDGSLYVVGAKTGQMLWKFATEGIIRSRPALENGLVYIASDDGSVYAVSEKDGQQAWKADIGNAYPREKRENLGNSPSPTGFDYVQSSPVVADGLVYVGSFDGNVYALNSDTGKVAWTFKTDNKVRATPAIDGGMVYVGSWDENFYALDAKKGTALWTAPVGGEVQSTALVIDGLVITASRKASVQALDIKTGSQVWEFPYGNNMWVESSPTRDGDKIYIGASGSLMVMGLEYKTGKPSSMFISKSFHWSTPQMINGTLYIGGAAFNDLENGGLFALPVTDGKLPLTGDGRRMLKITNTLEASGKITGVAGSPVIADGMIFFGGLDGSLYAVKD